MRSKEELDAAWEKATGLHRAGKLNDAETIYRQMLASQPGLAPVWNQRASPNREQGRSQPKRWRRSTGRWRSIPPCRSPDRARRDPDAMRRDADGGAAVPQKLVALKPDDANGWTPA